MQQQQLSSHPTPASPSNPPHPEWVIVRPCDLIDVEVSKTKTKNQYVLHSKPIGSLFGSGTVSRASVAQFMTDLILDPVLFEQYKYQAPVIHGVVMTPMETDKTK
jgi:hypothetical protein